MQRGCRMSANTENYTPAGFVTVGALLLLDEGAYPTQWLSSPNMLAQAQVAIDFGITLDEVLDAPKLYAEWVWPITHKLSQNELFQEPEETDEGMDFGAYALRQPTGRDLIFSERETPRKSLAMCFARCAGISLAEVKGLNLKDYYRGEAWLGEELGVSAPAPSAI